MDAVPREGCAEKWEGDVSGSKARPAAAVLLMGDMHEISKGTKPLSQKLDKHFPA